MMKCKFCVLNININYAIIFTKKVLKQSCVLNCTDINGAFLKPKHRLNYKNNREKYMKTNIRNRIKIVMILIMNVMILTTIIFIINMDRSGEKYEYEKNRYNVLKNVQESVDSILEINVKLTNVIAMSNEAMAYANDEKINHYNAAKLAGLIKSYTSFCRSKIYIFQPDKDIYIGDGVTYHSEDIIKFFGCIPYDMDFLREQKGGCYSSRLMGKDTGDSGVTFINKSVTIDGNTIYFIINLGNELMERFFYDGEEEVYLGEENMVLFGGKSIGTGEAKRSEAALSVPSRVIHNWSYVYVPHDKGRIWIYIRWIVMLLTGAVLASFLGILAADRLYRPVRRLIERISGDDVVEDDLEYIENKMIEMKSRHEGLQREMNAYLDRFEQQFLKNILYGISTPRDINEYEKHMKNVEEGGRYNVVLLECCDDDEHFSKTFYEVSEYIHKMSNGKVVSLENKRFCVIVYRTEEDIFKKFTMILIGLEERFDIHYIGAVSDEYSDGLAGIAKIFASEDRSLRNKALTGENIMIRAYENENSDYYYTVEMEKIIMDFIKDNNFDDAAAAIDSVLRKNLSECELTHEALTDFKLAMASTIKRTLKILGKSEAALFGDDCVMYVELGDMRNSEGMRQKINSVFKTIFDSCRDNKEKSNNFLVESIIKYIHENYHDSDKVCLIGAAEHFNVSTSYISRIFKKHTGVNYKEYITSYRIDKAKQLIMQDSHTKIKDICEKVGYTNMNSFIRAFEKLEGISPDTFRKRHQ